MKMQKISTTLRGLIAALFLFAALPAWLVGCMTVDDRHTIVESTNSSKTFGNKTISILLPTKSQTSSSLLTPWFL